MNGAIETGKRAALEVAVWRADTRVVSATHSSYESV